MAFVAGYTRHATAGTTGNTLLALLPRLCQPERRREPRRFPSGAASETFACGAGAPSRGGAGASERAWLVRDIASYGPFGFENGLSYRHLWPRRSCRPVVCR